MILFSPDERNNYTDPSYHLPAFYELWARWGPEADRAFWPRAADGQPGVLRESDQSEDRPGLRSWAISTARRWMAPGSRGAAFREDAWRWPGTGRSTGRGGRRTRGSANSATDSRAFFESKGMETYGNNSKLDGIASTRPPLAGARRHQRRRVLRRDRPRSRGRFTDALWQWRSRWPALPLLRPAALHDELAARERALQGHRAEAVTRSHCSCRISAATWGWISPWGGGASRFQMK